MRPCQVSARSSTAPLRHGERSGREAAIARTVVETARRAESPHLIYISIIGVEQVPPGYQDKLAAEHLIEGAGLCPTRSCGSHSSTTSSASCWRHRPRAPVLLIPALPFQPIDVRDLAGRLLELSLKRPGGPSSRHRRTPGLRGPGPGPRFTCGWPGAAVLCCRSGGQARFSAPTGKAAAIWHRNARSPGSPSRTASPRTRIPAGFPTERRDEGAPWVQRPTAPEDVPKRNRQRGAKASDRPAGRREPRSPDADPPARRS